MHMRLQEVLEYALDEITRAGYHQRLPAGVILTGGGALTPGIVELAREVFAMPARVGVPGQRLRGLADSVESPRMAVPAGLVLYGARQVDDERRLRDRVPGSRRRSRRCSLR